MRRTCACVGRWRNGEGAGRSRVFRTVTLHGGPVLTPPPASPARCPARGACSKRQGGAGAGVGRGESQGRGGRWCRALGGCIGGLCVAGLVAAARRVLCSVPSCSPAAPHGEAVCGCAKRGSEAVSSATAHRGVWKWAGPLTAQCADTARLVRVEATAGRPAPSRTHWLPSAWDCLGRSCAQGRQPAGADAALMRMCTERRRVGGCQTSRACPRLPNSPLSRDCYS